MGKRSYYGRAIGVEGMSWCYAERGDLHLAVRVLTLDDITADEAGMCLFKLLDELELYDDPEQGSGRFKAIDEMPLIEELAINLKKIIGDTYPSEAGERAINHPEWSQAVSLAKKLLLLLRNNGLGV